MSAESWLQMAKQRVGILEWFRPAEYQRTEAMLQDLNALGVTKLRTGISWADWHTKEGRQWFDWFIPAVSRDVELLPCFTYTPPSLGIEAKTSSPPRDLHSYSEFVEQMISRYGRHFDWVELWNEPNNLNDWDWRLDQNWELFSEMITLASRASRKLGKKTVLAGMCPTDPFWLGMMAARGVLDCIDAVGLHGFPGTWEFDDDDWDGRVGKVRRVLEQHGVAPQIWLTEVGYSTWRHDEMVQIRHLINALDAGTERVYWYSGYDLHPHESHQEGFHEDERHYHFGLRTADGTPKLIYRVWEESGLEGLRKLDEAVVRHEAGLFREPTGLKVGSHAVAVPEATKLKPVLITGGAGFVGTNLAARLLEQDRPVLIFDSLSRRGVEQNLEWLCDTYGDRVQVAIGDVRDRHLVRNAVHKASEIYHLAAQVAVTCSVDRPLEDFDINVRGTLNILESLRQMAQPPGLLFTSTNKVYGELTQLPLYRQHHRYQVQEECYAKGISEKDPLDFHSPYGCSKGSADQYVLDYARTYGLRAAVFRMSCIYGTHQFGTEDQGWVAHFMIQALQGRPLTLYGDGRQVRDILYVDDLISAMLLAQEKLEHIAGQAFNIGGGAANSTSLLELLGRIEALADTACNYSFAPWRQGDQKYYVTDSRKFSEATGWMPQISIDEGLEKLYRWLSEQLPVQTPVSAHLQPAGGAVSNVSVR